MRLSARDSPPGPLKSSSPVVVSRSIPSQCRASQLYQLSTVSRSPDRSRSKHPRREELEETDLFAEVLRLDHVLSEQPLKLSGGLGGVAGEVVVDVAEHLASLLGVRPQHAGP